MMFHLYRLYDSGDRLLYIGLTGRAVPVRLVEHSKEQSWWPEVTKITVDRLGQSFERARQREITAIERENPIYNVQRPKPSPRPPAPRRLRPVEFGRVRVKHPLARKRDGTAPALAVALFDKLRGAEVRCADESCNRDDIRWTGGNANRTTVVPKDGDRTNATAANALPLCPSCAGRHNQRRRAA